MLLSFKQVLQELRAARQGQRIFALWLLGACLVVALIWTITIAKIDRDHAAVRDNAQRDTAGMVRSYSEQIARSVDYIDHLTLSLKYQWKTDAGSIHLEDQLKEGFFPLATYFYITLVDHLGNLVSTTSPHATVHNIATADYFIAHRDDAAGNLRISKPVPGKQAGEREVLFTRRMETASGAFAGVIVLAVTPSFFSTFKDDFPLGPSDCLSVRYLDGSKLVAKLGHDVRHFDSLFRSQPSFSEMNGLIRMAGTELVDGKPRILAWHRAHGHPLVASITLAEKDIFAEHAVMAQEHHRMAWLASVLCWIAALIGACLCTRLAWRKQQSEEIKDTYRLATDGAQEGFLMIRAIWNSSGGLIDFLVEDCNERGALLVDQNKGDLIGARFSSLYSDRQLAHLMSVFQNALSSGFHEEEFSMRRNGQRNRWLYRRLVRAGNSAIAMTVRDITESKIYEETLATMANFDALTSLRNRHWLTTFLPGAIDTARNSGTILGLLFIDLDKFKNINDTAGHATGDQLLAAVAIRLQSLLRAGDEAVRIGGDEFTIILNNLSHQDDVERAVSRLHASLLQPFVLHNQSFSIGATVGVSLFPQDAQDAETLLKNADMAMYCAKEDRHGGIRFYEPDMYERLKARAACEQELLAAVAGKQFALHYQPRVHSTSGEITGMEALVRWMHPVRGLVPPNDFIPLAEETGIVIGIGEQVMDMACAQIAQWQKQRFDVVPVSVNVSARQFSEGGVKHLIQECLNRHGVPARLLEIELTESAMLGDSEAVVGEVAAISALGVRIHIDDFGTGYSSLSLLHRLDMDVLKIDRAFTAQLGRGKGGEAMFEAIVSMAKALDMRVVAEGVETEDQLRIVRTFKVDEVQGYLFSRPLPAPEVVQFFSRGIRHIDAAAVA